MPHFKDSENKLYWLDDGNDPAVWLPQCIQITDAEAEVLRPKPPTPTYKELRAAEYPSTQDQLDLLYHGGMDAWKTAIQAVKDKYPKG
jgi:hypothetical protein